MPAVLLVPWAYTGFKCKERAQIVNVATVTNLMIKLTFKYSLLQGVGTDSMGPATATGSPDPGTG